MVAAVTIQEMKLLEMTSHISNLQTFDNERLRESSTSGQTRALSTNDI
jgi:hypothetical protein